MTSVSTFQNSPLIKTRLPWNNERKIMFNNFGYRNLKCRISNVVSCSNAVCVDGANAESQIEETTETSSVKVQKHESKNVKNSWSRKVHGPLGAKPSLEGTSGNPRPFFGISIPECLSILGISTSHPAPFPSPYFPLKSSKFP